MEDTVQMPLPPVQGEGAGTERTFEDMLNENKKPKRKKFRSIDDLRKHAKKLKGNL